MTPYHTGPIVKSEMKMLENTLKTLLENTADSNDRAERLVLLDLARQLVEKMEPAAPPNDMLVMTGYAEESGSKIRAIKALRSISRLGLKEAKTAVENCPIVLLPADHPNAELVRGVLTRHGLAVARLPEVESATLPKVDTDPEHWGVR